MLTAENWSKHNSRQLITETAYIEIGAEPFGWHGSPTRGPHGEGNLTVLPIFA
jgi:hypothetical protein